MTQDGNSGVKDIVMLKIEIAENYHNPNDKATQPQTVVGLDMKMTVQSPPPPSSPPQKLNGEHHGPHINIY